jgi:hypothetical protein
MITISEALDNVTLASLHHNGCLGRDLYAARFDVRGEVKTYGHSINDQDIETAAQLVVNSPINRRETAIPAVYYEETCAYLYAAAKVLNTAVIVEQNRHAYERGFGDFPAGRYMDAMRGTKSYPSYPRCPFRIPNKAKAWQIGFDDAMSAILAS